jgi:hypothetical protein
VTPAAFYCVCDTRYFLGAVGMINSLRLAGHTEPIYLLDCGLNPSQRALLAPEVELVNGPSDIPPYLLKTIAPLRHPAEVMVLIDVDMIVTRSLTGLIEKAAGGQVVAFRDRLDRFFPRWGELLELGPTRRQPYACVALVFLGGALGAEVIRLMDDRQARVDFELTFYRRSVAAYPFLYPEQDVLNAILSTRVEAEEMTVLETRLAPTQPFRDLRLLDAETLRCAYPDGSQPYVLHHFYRKPWLEPMYHGIYSRLLARLLLWEDVAIRVDESDVPLRMRDGRLAWVERKRVDLVDLTRWYTRDVLPEWTRARAAALRRRWAPRRS